MRKIRRFFDLILLRFIVSARNLIDFLAVIRRYYGDPLFRKIDIYLLRSYLHQNPYRMCRDFLKSKGKEEIYVYGETPLTTMEKIADESGIGPGDVVYELGSGRGRSCFWLYCFKKCRVVGIEFVPEFVSIAQKIQRKFGIDKVNFIFRDILNTPFSNATVIYFYGTIADSQFIIKLIDKFDELPKGTKVITVSYPLTHFSSKSRFEIIKSFSGKFTWGETEVYVQIKS